LKKKSKLIPDHYHLGQKIPPNLPSNLISSYFYIRSKLYPNYDYINNYYLTPQTFINNVNKNSSSFPLGIDFNKYSNKKINISSLDKIDFFKWRESNRDQAIDLNRKQQEKIKISLFALKEFQTPDFNLKSWAILIDLTYNNPNIFSKTVTMDYRQQKNHMLKITKKSINLLNIKEYAFLKHAIYSKKNPDKLKLNECFDFLSNFFVDSSSNFNFYDRSIKNIDLLLDIVDESVTKFSTLLIFSHIEKKLFDISSKSSFDTQKINWTPKMVDFLLYAKAVGISHKVIATVLSSSSVTPLVLTENAISKKIQNLNFKNYNHQLSNFNQSKPKKIGSILVNKKISPSLFLHAFMNSRKILWKRFSDEISFLKRERISDSELFDYLIENLKNNHPKITDEVCDSFYYESKETFSKKDIVDAFITAFEYRKDRKLYDSNTEPHEYSSDQLSFLLSNFSHFDKIFIDSDSKDIFTTERVITPKFDVTIPLNKLFIAAGFNNKSILPLLKNLNSIEFEDFCKIRNNGCYDFPSRDNLSTPILFDNLPKSTVVFKDLPFEQLCSDLNISNSQENQSSLYYLLSKPDRLSTIYKLTFLSNNKTIDDFILDVLPDLYKTYYLYNKDNKEVKENLKIYISSFSSGLISYDDIESKFNYFNKFNDLISIEEFQDLSKQRKFLDSNSELSNIRMGIKP
jgi:hypothetical protein